MFLEVEPSTWRFKPVSRVHLNAAPHNVSSAHWARILLLRLIYLSSLSWFHSYSFSQQHCQLRGPHAHNIGELLVWHWHCRTINTSTSGKEVLFKSKSFIYIYITAALFVSRNNAHSLGERSPYFYLESSQFRYLEMFPFESLACL